MIGNRSDLNFKIFDRSNLFRQNLTQPSLFPSLGETNRAKNISGENEQDKRRKQVIVIHIHSLSPVWFFFFKKNLIWVLNFKIKNHVRTWLRIYWYQMLKLTYIITLLQFHVKYKFKPIQLLNHINYNILIILYIKFGSIL